MRTMLGIAAFEMRTQMRRISTWVYLFVFALIAFLIVAMMGGAIPGADTGNAVTLVNSPLRVARIMLTLSILGVLITAGLAGGAVFRDFQTVSVQGTLTWHVADPALLAERVDFSIGLFTGAYQGEPIERIETRQTAAYYSITTGYKR